MCSHLRTTHKHVFRAECKAIEYMNISQFIINKLKTDKLYHPLRSTDDYENIALMCNMNAI